ncbi:MAG TPA: nucleotidyltransferase domain-containing protein, partial [Chitinophagaceae bacterium]
SKKNLLQNNAALSSIFFHMADCYRYLGDDNRFRAIAYDKVGKVLTNMKEDIATYAKDVKTLDEIGGIGESIAEKIMEYLQTGKIKTFEQLKKQVPYELLELMDITGFGPATLKLLHEKLRISNREDLIHALEKDKLRGVKGFAEKKIENMKRALKLFKENKRMPLKAAEKTGNEILSEINKIPGVQKAALAGSLRRKKETVGDIDIVILAEPKNRKKIVTLLIALPQVEKVLAKGVTKASVLLKNRNIQVDIRLVHDYEYGAAMLYFTGSKEHNIKLRTIAKQRGYKINEYGIFDAASHKRLAGETEEEMYRFLNLKYIPPEQRLDKGEIEKAVLAKEFSPAI